MTKVYFTTNIQFQPLIMETVGFLRFESNSNKAKFGLLNYTLFTKSFSCKRSKTKHIVHKRSMPYHVSADSRCTVKGYTINPVYTRDIYCYQGHPPRAASGDLAG